MKKRSIAAVLAAVTVGFPFLCVRPILAQGTEIHVFVSNGVKSVIDELRPQAERAIGHSMAIQFGTTASLKQKIEAGEAFDAAILTSEAVADLVKEGKVASGTRADLARCGIGVGVRAGASKPDIRTPDSLKRTLLSAKSITYAKDGASRAYLDKMFERLGIAAEMKSKTLLAQGSVGSNALVKDGQAELILTLVSEILPAAGVELVGPLPADVQSYVNFAAGVSTKASNAAAGEALIRFLKASGATPIYKAKGLEPR